MTLLDFAMLFFGIAAVASPFVLVVTLGLPALMGWPLTERSIARLTQASVTFGLIASVAMLVVMLSTDRRYIPIELGDWVSIPQEHFHFHLKFIFDRLSVPFVILSFVLCGTVGAFTSRYLHREPGYGRFYLFYAFFLSGMVVSSLAGTIETLFFGWELVGLASALLVAYFHDRENPVRNGLRVWSVYRLADAAFLLAAIMMHHFTNSGDFTSLIGQGSWPDGALEPIDHNHAVLVGSLLLIAAAGKSGLVPFSGWLPRAMEGPTPSSAVFYGALSVHLGAYLLLRTSPILEASLTLQVMVVVLGLVTAVFATILSRVQSDIKTSLAYASLTQVGIIVVEIGLGFRYLALVHIIGHACMRTLQLLRAPSLLLDYRRIENAIGSRIDHPITHAWRFPFGDRQAWYRFGFERGYTDLYLDRLVVEPFAAAFRWADRAERRWTDWLSREPSRESDQVEHHPEIEERSL